MVSVTLATREYLRHLFDTFLWFLCSDESLKPPAQGMQLYVLQPQQKKCGIYQDEVQLSSM